MASAMTLQKLDFASKRRSSCKLLGELNGSFPELDPIALLSHSQKLHHYFVYAKAKTFQTNHMQQLFYVLNCLQYRHRVGGLRN